MSSKLDILAELAFAMENVSVSDEPFAPCTQPGQQHGMYSKLDEYGSWYYWLIVFNYKTGFAEYIRDKNGWCIWCPMWHYSKTDAVIDSLTRSIELHNSGNVEFSDISIYYSNLDNPETYMNILKSQIMAIEHRETNTPIQEKTPEWESYIIKKKRSITAKITTLLG